MNSAIKKCITGFFRIGVSIVSMFSFNNLAAQTELVISGKTYSNSSELWQGVNIPRSVPTKLIFKNNSISSANRFGYLLQAGDEGQASTNNNLDGALITGNKLSWRGTDMDVIPHGIFTGHNKNVIIKYNFLNNVPMGIIRKSATGMRNNSGGVAYNIVRGGAVGVVVKGMSDVKVYNNTFYQDRTREQTWRPFVHIYTNTDNGLNSVSHNTKIYNNIFYAKHETPMITVADKESLNGFECDYNLYWCEAGSPRFVVNENEITFEQWQQMGFDTHSIVMNPKFIDFESLVPHEKLEYGVDLGEEWKEGLSINSTWSTTDPLKAFQNGRWQVGARIYSSNDIEGGNTNIPLHTQSVINNATPSVIEMTFSLSLATNPPPVTAFNVYSNSIPVAIKETNISGRKVLITLTTSLGYNDVITLEYFKPAENPIETPAGAEAPAISNHLVINNILSGATGNDQIVIFPNPAKTYFNISKTGSDVLPQTIKIFDTSGRLIFHKKMDSELLYKVPVNLTPGTYFLNIIFGSEKDFRQRLIIIR
ncbi:MAG TPA: T9SS type A sorting domain-containing protein [Bacteroidales bacterium]|nr:T9SS type A sorting domain-containing protein [Bacteroidales bacterium]